MLSLCFDGIQFLQHFRCNYSSVTELILIKNVIVIFTAYIFHPCDSFVKSLGNLKNSKNSLSGRFKKHIVQSNKLNKAVGICQIKIWELFIYYVVW